MTEPTGQLSRGDATLAPSPSSLVDSPLVDEVSGTWGASPAPDGSAMAVISDRAGSPALWILDAAGRARPVDVGPHPVTAVAWSRCGEWIAYAVAPGGAPRTEVWLVRPDGRGLCQVAGFGADTAVLAGWLPADGLAVTELGGGGGRALIVDAAGRLPLAELDLMALLDVTPDGRTALLRRGPRGRRHLEVLDLATGARRALVDAADRGCFTPDGQAVLARSDARVDLARLVRAPLDGSTVEVLAERVDGELDDFAVAPDGRLALLWNVDGGASVLVLRDLDGTETAVPAGPVVRDPQFSADGTILTVTVEGPLTPCAVWRVEARTGDAAPVETPLETGFAGVRPELRRFRAADGLALTGWLYRPDNPTGAAVISLHSGPEAQERPGYNPLFQSLAARGITVFAPNVRGSSGFGRAFVDADNGALRHGAIADVAASVAHLLDTGIAEPGRIGCMGRSYGGYLTLAALVTYPELFAVGVDVCGMADFATFYAGTEPWIAAAAVSKYGHPDHDRDTLHALSPLHRLDRLAAPLLVVHGDNDTNVPTGEAEQVVAALAARGFPHHFLRFPDEGHEFLDPANRETYVRATVTWLHHHLARH
jgi:dipeptidyl aminopeptidase/acylaminoacyl peptidase